MWINKRDFSFTHVVYDDNVRKEYFECDDLIAPVIRELNLRGYKTEFCCSGHPYMCNGEVHIDQPYVLFVKPIDESISPPDGWYFDDCYRSIRTEYVCDDMNLSLMDALKIVMDKMTKLYEWVASLPDAHDGEHMYIVRVEKQSTQNYTTFKSTRTDYIIQASSHRHALNLVCGEAATSSNWLTGKQYEENGVVWMEFRKIRQPFPDINAKVGEIVDTSTPTAMVEWNLHGLVEKPDWT